MELYERADRHLERISELQAEIEALQREFTEELERLKEAYRSRIEPLREALRGEEKALVGLMRRHRGIFFGEGDKVELEHGSLLYGKVMKLQVPRGALQRLKELGWTEAIRIQESLDRRVLEGWPEERLFVIGAKKRLVEEFKYALKEKG